MRRNLSSRASVTPVGGGVGNSTPGKRRKARENLEKEPRLLRSRMLGPEALAGQPHLRGGNTSDPHKVRELDGGAAAGGGPGRAPQEPPTWL